MDRGTENWARGLPEPESGACPKYWQSAASGLWLTCVLDDWHESECRCINGWRSKTEMKETG